MQNQPLQQIRATFQQRREAIDELHFVYKRLEKLVPKIARHLDEPWSTMLQQQHATDRVAHAELVRSAVEYGHVPGPCMCAEGAELTDRLFQVARTTVRSARAAAVLEALIPLRVYLIQSFSRLLDPLPVGAFEGLHATAVALQRVEAEHHRHMLAYFHDRSSDVGMAQQSA